MAHFAQLDSKNTVTQVIVINDSDAALMDGTEAESIGIAFCQPQKHEDDTVDPFLYEIYYDYPVNDSITVTPAFFGGKSKNGSGAEVDMTGIVLNTTLKF